MGRLTSSKMSWLARLHRRVALILVLQVLLWLISGLYLAWHERDVLTSSQYWHQLPATPLAEVNQLAIPDLQIANLGDVRSVKLSVVDTLPQFTAAYVASNTPGHLQWPNAKYPQEHAYAWFDGRSGHRWQTTAIEAQRLAVSSYSGSGMFNGIRDLHRSDELPHWQGPGFRVDFADSLQTRVYIDEASGIVLGHRNNKSALIDWMYRLHFMDYSGKGNFNNLLIISVGLLSVWLCITGVLMIVRVAQQGGFVARRRLPYNSRHSAAPQPVNTGVETPPQE